MVILVCHIIHLLMVLLYDKLGDDHSLLQYIILKMYSEYRFI